MDANSPRLPFLLGVAVVGLFLAALAALWRYTPLRELANVDGLIDRARDVADQGFPGILILLAAFVVGSCLMFPVTVMIAATAIAMGPVWGFLTALAGSIAASAVVFGIGKWTGSRWVSRFGGRLVNRLSRRLAREGIFAVALVRVVPIAPFTVVNLVAGASQMRFTSFIVGTVIGMGPGVLAFSLLGHRLERALRDPRPATIALVVAAGLAIAGVGWAANRLFGNRFDESNNEGKA